MPNSSIPAGTAPQYGSGWSFQVTDNSLDQLINNKAKLLVIDYSKSGGEADRYTKGETDALHQNGKELISYLSIGEAEDYRYYYQPSWKTNPPSWLGRENPDWPGNAKVQYWNPEWQQYMIGYLDKIIDSGFDGIYLDIIDGFDYWSDSSNGEKVVLDRADAANRMIDFVEKLTEHARVTRGKPNFHVIPQNAEDLLPYDTSGKFLREISAVGVEDLFYEGTRPQSAASIAERSANLNKITAAGKPVFVIDYVNDTTGYQGANKARIDDFWTRTLLAGYTPQVSFTNSSILGEDPINQLKIASGNTAVSLPAVNLTPVTSLVPVITAPAPTIVNIPVAAPPTISVNIPPIVTPPATVIMAEPNVVEVMPPPVAPVTATTPPVLPSAAPVIVPVAVPIATPVNIAVLEPVVTENREFNRGNRQRYNSRSEQLSGQKPQSLEQQDVLTGNETTENLTGDRNSDIITGDLGQGTIATANFNPNTPDRNVPTGNLLDIASDETADVFPRRHQFAFAKGDRGDLLQSDQDQGACRKFEGNSGELQAKPLILDTCDPMI
jgi:cysteinyl-tRNA synthetase, unknown class